MSHAICMPLQDHGGKMVSLPSGQIDLEVPLGHLDLTLGRYSMTVAVVDADTSVSLIRAEGLCPFRLLADRVHWCKVVRPVHPTASRVASDSRNALV